MEIGKPYTQTIKNKQKMKKHFFGWTAVIALLCTAGLVSCNEKKEEKQAVADGKPVVEIPKDLYRYTAADQANKKGNMAVEKLGFSKKLNATNKEEFKGNKSIKELYLLDGFGHVAESSFEGCTELEKLVMTGTIDVLNDHAFEGCTKLKGVDGDIRTIGLATFKGCTSLEYLRTTDNLYWVRDESFAGCTNLKSIILGTTLVKFEDGAFKDCPNVEEVSIPSDFRRHMFNVYKDMKKLNKVYLLVMECYPFPENLKDFPCEQVDLYVPDNLVAQYKENESWKRFKSILPLSQSQYYTAEGWRK